MSQVIYTSTSGRYTKGNELEVRGQGDSTEKIGRLFKLKDIPSTFARVFGLRFNKPDSSLKSALGDVREVFLWLKSDL